jgi:uncharacterized protein YndB with AHSA1/START domain
VPREVRSYQGSGSPDRELVLTRTFDAPRELVFDAFTNPQHLIRWWGPEGCSVISCEADPRPGGTWCICMKSPRVLPQFVNRYPVNPATGRTGERQTYGGRAVSGDGHEWIVETQRGVYQEVIKPERLVFTYAFEDETGQPLHQTVVTINFAEDRGRTKLTLHQAIFESASARDDHAVGWSEALEHLTAYLAKT